MKTIYQSNRDLANSFGLGNNTYSANLYIGLSTSATISEATFVEPTTGSYARVALANSAANFTVASNKSISTNAAITFEASTGDWGTAYAIGIFDSLTAGHLLYYQALTTPRAVPSGTTLRISAGALTITET